MAVECGRSVLLASNPCRLDTEVARTNEKIMRGEVVFAGGAV